MMAHSTRLLLLSGASVLAGIALIFNKEGSPLISSLGFALVGGTVTFHMIPALGPSFIRVGLSGRDLNKVEQRVLPETMGAVAALVYLFCLFFFTPTL